MFPTTCKNHTKSGKMVSGPVKKKKVSKKLKASWRKHVNIDDVEDFLEEKRFEERLGPLSAKKNEELFVLDTGEAPKPKVTTRQQRKLEILTKPLRSFSALQPHSQVPDPIAKRNRVRTIEERRSSIIKAKEKREKSQGVFKKKDLNAMENRKLADLKRARKHKRGEYKEDLWNNEEKETTNLSDPWMSKNTTKHNLRNLGKPQKKPVNSITEKKSILPAIEPPHPGMSYNPAFEDHQNLLKIVAEKEAKLIKEEEHLNRVTRGMFQKVTPETRDTNWLVEMSQGLPRPDIKDEEESSDPEGPPKPPIKTDKKTLKQRRKQKEQRKLLLELRKKKLEKKKISDIHQIKLIKTKIEKDVKKQTILQEKRQKKEKYKEKEAKRLGAIKFEEPDLEFNLGQDIKGSLRNVKKEGNLLASRFKSMQQRNILHPTVRHVRKNVKVKRFTKPGHKEDWKNSVSRAFL